MSAPLLDRFMACVEPDLNTGCWLWSGAYRDTTRRYGGLKINYRTHRAHRVSWMLFRSGSPAMVCHRCDTPLCVNPDHLFAGDARANVADMMAKGRKRSLRGDQHPTIKLSDADVAAIRASPLSPRELAERFRVHLSHIYSIRSGHRRAADAALRCEPVEHDEPVPA